MPLQNNQLNRIQIKAYKSIKDCNIYFNNINAMKNKFCPSCNNEYELLSDDWVMIELKKV